MNPHSSPVDSDRAAIDWRTIEDLLDELGLVAESATGGAEFCRLLLARLVPAAGASGGAIWSCSQAGQVRLEGHFEMAGGGAASGEAGARHKAMLLQTLAAGESRVVGPNAETPSGSGGQGPDRWLVLYPFTVGPQARGVIELASPYEVTPTRGRDYQRILAAVAEVVESFYRQHELGELRNGAQRWQQFDQFAQRVHRSLDLQQTAYAIANDGRRVIGCDRLSVLVRHGSKFRAVASSGVDLLERRSKAVGTLERLATRAAATGEPLWYHDGVADLPDEIQQPLDAYLEESHARIVAVVPLFEPDTEGAAARRVIGVLVADHFEGSAEGHRFRQRTGAISQHASSAVQRAGPFAPSAGARRPPVGQGSPAGRAAASSQDRAGRCAGGGGGRVPVARSGRLRH